MPTSYTDETGFGLDLWVRRMKKKRSELKTNGANGNQVQRLESIGMQWDDDAVNKKENVRIRRVKPGMPLYKY